VSTWTGDELNIFDAHQEIQIAPLRPDGSPLPFTTIWIVRHTDQLYVRSWTGPTGRWYRAALRSHRGRIRVGEVDRHVTFAEVDVDPEAIDTAYRQKYGRSSYVNAMVSPAAATTTFRIYTAD
jgi:hypothetical protein